MSETPDPRFLGGEKAVLTNTADMAFVVAAGWDGAVDLTANIPRSELAAHLRALADQLDPPGEML